MGRNQGSEPGVAARAFDPPWIALFLGVGVLYAIGAELAWRSFGANSPGFAFFPPAGITLAALVLTRRARWSAVIAAIVVVEGVVDLRHGLGLGSTLGYIGANTVEPVVGALAYQALRAPGPRLATRRDFSWFVLGACIAGPIAGSVVAATTKTIDAGGSWIVHALHFWAGDGVAVLAIGAAVVLVFSEPENLRGHAVELTLSAIALVGLSVVALVVELPPAVLILPVFAWGAFRLGRIGVAILGAVFAITVNYLTAAGEGDFAQLDVGASAQLAVTQVYIAVMIVVAWLIAVEVEERLGALQAGLTLRDERDQATAVAEVLQHAVQPRISLAIGEFRIGAAYQPAAEVVGGDWYDALELPGGGIFFAVGDVVGHGLAAVDDMNQLRFASRTLALEGHGPARILAEMSQLARRVTHGRFATLAAAVYDPAAGVLRYANAGHPPSMLRRSASGEVRLLEGALGPPLGVRTAEPYPEATVRLDARDAVLFYSDGLIERRGHRIDEGLELAREALQLLPERGSLDDFCQRLIDTIYPGSGGGDDTCVLVVRRAS